MKLKITHFIAIASMFISLSFRQDTQNSCDVFLAIDYKNKVTFYNTATKQKIIKQLGHNFKDEDYLLFSIHDSNDSMYYVEASYAIAGKPIKGWISKKTKLSVFAKAYNKRLILYKSYSKKMGKTTIDYVTKELEILNYHDGWLKVRVALNKKSFWGWIPPGEQCSNPYTTCN